MYHILAMAARGTGSSRFGRSVIVAYEPIWYYTIVKAIPVTGRADL
jgi:hypothetical protein